MTVALLVEETRQAQGGALGYQRRKGPLSGLVLCGECGSPAWIWGATGYRGYRCRHWQDGCLKRSVKVDVLEAAVLDWWRSLVTAGDIREVAGIIVQEEYQAAVEAAQRRGPLEERFDELKRQEQRLIELQLAGGDTPAVAERLKSILDEQDRLSVEIVMAGCLDFMVTTLVNVRRRNVV